MGGDMIGGLFISAYARNLGVFATTWPVYSGALTFAGRSGGVANSNINISKSTITVSGTDGAPAFRIVRLHGVTGGGGGGGTVVTSVGGDGQGGRAGNLFSLLGVLRAGGMSFGGGVGGTPGNNGTRNTGQSIDPALKLDSSEPLPLGGAGGAGAVAPTGYDIAGEKSMFTPIGDGGDGASRLGDGYGKDGNLGTVFIEGLIS